ncbi:trichohyalin-like [Scomber japonicus]|uniref:trichohyalin-like n=1 Tax=Scomber japonicus TaxID=13676 RepID=UPI0023055230|nr:trichohyalin-like [Scomber japonicus]XP_053171101.1 trichohyalin-like [Scomber japonicus]
MESSIEASQTQRAPKPKPPAKPRLAPRPFSLQKNTTIHSIHAPKTVTGPSQATTHQTGTSEAPDVPKATLTTPDQKPPQQPATSDSKLSSVTVNTKDQQKTATENKSSLRGEDTLDSIVAQGKSDPASQSAPPKETSKSEPIQKEDVIQTNHSTSTDVVTNSEQRDEKKKDDQTETTVVQNLEVSGGDDSSTAKPIYRRSSGRNRLSAVLTSKFESGGLPLPPQPTITISTTTSKDAANKPVPPDLEQSLTTSEPTNKESDEGKLTEEYSGGGSIKRRISLLFDSSSKPEPIAKRDEPEIINGGGGVKERIKNWKVETGSEGPKIEKKPQVAPRIRIKSSDSATAPTAEKTPKSPPVELPGTGTSSTETVDPTSKISPEEQPAKSPLVTSKDAPPEVKSSETSQETPGEREQSKSTEGGVQQRACSPPATLTATDEGSAAASESAVKSDNVRRRSVHFGVVERDDGGPPIQLCSEPEFSTEEDEAPQDKSEEDPLVVKDSEAQEEKRLKQLEFEKKRKEEESLKEKERLELEEKNKRKEEEEKEKAKQMRKEERRREEERKREKLKEEEKERQKKEEAERERLREEERERERLKEEEMERERQMELMLQRQKEEERDRAKQMEEVLKHEQEERDKEKLKDEERKKELLREERERQRLNKTEELRGREDEEERQKELELVWQRKNEEDGVRARQKEEILRQEQKEKERLREEERQKEEERMRERQRELEEEERELERKRQQETEEMAKMKQMEMERQREEEIKIQMEKEVAEELEKKHQRELERKRAEELEEKLRLREKEEITLTNLQKEEEGEQEMSVDEPEPNLISFDSEDLPQKSEMSVDEPEPDLISFDSEDVPQKSKSPHTPSDQTHEPTESQTEVVYDDFSVRNPCVEVDFDDFSVKPKRWGSQAKVETSPVQSSSLYSPDQEVATLVPLEVRTDEKKVPEQLEKPGRPEPVPAQQSPEKEEEEKEEEEEEEGKETEKEIEKEKEEGKEKEGEMGIEKEKEKQEEKEMKVDEEVEKKEDGGEEDDKQQETQLNSYCTDGQDTDALIDLEPDQQNGACEPTSESHSVKPAADQLPEVSSEDVETTDFQPEPDLPPFPESSTPLLDTSAQRSKADLGKRRIRTRPPSRLCTGLTQTDGPDWRSSDSTVEKEESSKQRESDSEEEQPKPKIVCSPPPTSQRVPIFPGLNPAALIAQLKKKTGGGGAGGGDETDDKSKQAKESPNEEIAPSPSQLSRSSRSASHLAGAARVLPPIGKADGGAVSSPAWLKELKSKKRLSQHEGEA